MEKALYLEDNVSKYPAIQLLQSMGYTYISPEDCALQRGSSYASDADYCFWLNGTYSKGYDWKNATATADNFMDFDTAGTLSSPVDSADTLLEALNDYVAANISYLLRSWINTVYPYFDGTIVTSPQTEVYAEIGNTADFTSLAAGTDITYQWQLSTDTGASWTNVTEGYGGTTPTYTCTEITEAMEDYQYRCVFSGSLYSPSLTLMLGEAPYITKQPTDDVEAIDHVAYLSLQATGTPEVIYVWYFSDDGGINWYDAGYYDDHMYWYMDSDSDGYLFYCTVSNAVGSVDSDIVGVYFPVAAAITGEPSGKTVAVGATASFTVTVSGKPDPSCQWQVSTDGSTWNNVTTGTGGTSASYTTQAATTDMDEYIYHCIATNREGSDTSDNVQLRVLYFTSSDADGMIFKDESITLVPSIDGGSWFFETGILSRSGNDFTGLAEGNTTVIYSVNGVNIYYDVIVSEELILTVDPSDAVISSGEKITITPNITGGEWSFDSSYFSKTGNEFTSLKAGNTQIIYTASSQSKSVDVTITEPATILQGPEDTTAAEGELAEFTVTASGSPDPFYQWQVSTDGLTWSNVTVGTGGTAAIYTTQNTTASMNGYLYRCIVSNSEGSDISDNALLQVLYFASSDADATVYQGGRITLTPNIEDGLWNWDEAYFSATFNSPATFTALKAGKSSITYTASGATVTYNVTIIKVEMPKTGEDLRMLYIQTSMGLLAAIAAIVLIIRHRMIIKD